MEQMSSASSEPAVLDGPDETDAPIASHLQRFCISLAIGAAVILVPYLWVLTDLWNGRPSLFRTVIADHRLSNFYEIQGRALLAGHLYVPNGSLGVEAFLHGGRQYMYFGLFPSLIRLPVLLVTHSLDGRMTAISVLLAWIVTALTSGAILWHCRVSLRGSSHLGNFEAASYAMVFATLLGGSALVNLAANPWVYSEDIAWSVALSLVATVAVIAVLARPSWWRVTALFLAVLAVNLTRGTTGIAWSVGAIAAGAWLGWRRPEGDTRNWWLPTVAAGVIPLVVYFGINWLKFGVFNGYPLQDQLWYRTNHVAGINHGHYLQPQLLTHRPEYLLRQPGSALLEHLPLLHAPAISGAGRGPHRRVRLRADDEHPRLDALAVPPDLDRSIRDPAPIVTAVGAADDHPPGSRGSSCRRALGIRIPGQPLHW